MAKKYDKKPHLQTSLWKTEAEWWAWLRGKSRQIWSDYPIRNNFKRTKLVPNFEGSKVTNSRVKSVGQCQICNEWFAGSNLQVDHITQAGSIGNSWEGYFNWFYDLLAEEDNMQLVCIPCHKIKSHADRLGVSFETAKIKKEIIAFSKLTEEEQKGILNKRGCIPVATKAGRVRQYSGIIELE
jgi:5-methylcytosine-specific restriction endonuclease McrA